MIKSTEITNFQGHKYSLLDFDQGVNIIKGRSHSGKSSIIRSLIWALQNRPQGFHFKSHFAGKKDTTDVSIEFTDEEWLSRQRHNKFNGYAASTLSGHLEALRTDVPEEITDLSQLSNINIQSQADKYFLLQESPGYVAKVLNNIVGLDIIDTVNRLVSSIIKRCNSDCVRLDREIAEKKEELEKYKHLDKIEKLVDAVTLLEADHKMYKTQEEELGLQIDKLVECQDDLGTITEWLEIESQFKRLKRKQERLAKLLDKSEGLDKEIKHIDLIRSQIDLLETSISFEDDVKEAKQLNGKRFELKNKRMELKKLCSDIQTVEKSLNFTSDTLKNDLKEREQLLKQHKDKFCSKCGAYRKYWRQK